jgi:DNA-binding XRE family transcriptional regulator
MHTAPVRCASGLLGLQGLGSGPNANSAATLSAGWDTVSHVTRRHSYEVLASNLHRLVFERGVTLEDVARAAGISLERLQAICTGEFDPDLDLVDRIAQAVGVTASELLTETEYN